MLFLFLEVSQGGIPRFCFGLFFRHFRMRPSEQPSIFPMQTQRTNGKKRIPQYRPMSSQSKIPRMCIRARINSSRLSALIRSFRSILFRSSASLTFGHTKIFFLKAIETIPQKKKVELKTKKKKKEHICRFKSKMLTKLENNSMHFSARKRGSKRCQLQLSSCAYFFSNVKKALFFFNLFKFWIGCCHKVECIREAHRRCSLPQRCKGF